MTDKFELMRQAINFWGEESQMLLTIEEMNELSQNLLRKFRNNRKVTWDDIAEEIADVELMLSQLKMFGTEGVGIVRLPNAVNLGHLVEKKMPEKIAKLEMLIKKIWK